MDGAIGAIMSTLRSETLIRLRSSRIVNAETAPSRTPKLLGPLPVGLPIATSDS